MASKRQMSTDAKDNLPLSKIPKHRRTNSGSVPEAKYDEVAGIMDKLLPLCKKLEGLLVDADKPRGLEASTPISSKKVNHLPLGFVDKLKRALDSGIKMKEWLADDPQERHSSDNSSRITSTNDEGKRSNKNGEEEEYDSGETEVTNRLSFSYLTHVAEDVRSNLYQLRDLRLQVGQDFKVEIIPFSSVVAADYKKLAIADGDQSYGRKVDDLWNTLENNEAAVDFDRIDHEALVRFITEWEGVQRSYINPWSEMTARKVIDGYLDTIRNSGIFSDDLRVITSPEFRILDRAQKSEPNKYPILNQDAKLKTYLNGSTDYLTVLATGEALDDLLEYGRKQWRSKGEQKRWLERVIGLALRDNTVRFSICEAKWPGAKLEDHIPQVVAEAIGLRLRTDRRYIPFCLSNGLEWVFGALQGHSHSFSVRHRFWVTEIYRIDAPQKVFKVLAILRYWAVSEEAEIWNLGCPENWHVIPDKSGSLVETAQQAHDIASSSKAEPSCGQGEEEESSFSEFT